MGPSHHEIECISSYGIFERCGGELNDFDRAGSEWLTQLRFPGEICQPFKRTRASRRRGKLPPEAMAHAVYAGISAQARNALTGVPQEEMKAYFSTLNAQDLVLAYACRSGIRDAWEEFVTWPRESSS